MPPRAYDYSSKPIQEAIAKPLPRRRQHWKIWIGLAGIPLIVGVVVLATLPFRVVGIQSNRAVSATRLHNLRLAIQAYCDAHDGKLPTNILGADGRPLLSWRVRILPYLGRQELYDEFHLDEPWDSPHNAALIPKMPRGLFVSRRSGFDEDSGKTSYLGIAGAGGVFEPGGDPLSLDRRQDPVALMVEVDDETAVVWTQPADWEYDPEQPVAGLRVVEDWFTVVLSNGRVLTPWVHASKEDLQSLFDREQKRPLNLDDWY